MKPTLIAGIGGLVLGHILWLIGITVATSFPSVSVGVLVETAVIVVVGVLVGYLSRRMYLRKRMAWAAFLGCLPILPVMFTLIVLGVMYV